MQRAPQSVVCPAVAVIIAGSVAASCAVGGEHRLLLAGSSGTTQFLGGHQLSNGDLLVCGSTDDLAWTGDVPRVEFPRGSLPNTGGTQYGFMVHLSPDLGVMRRVYHFPKGVVGTITRIRSTEVPGMPTGDLYISGEVATFTSHKDDGYFIARLDGNGVTRPPSAAVWTSFVRAGGRDAAGHKPGGYRADGAYEKGQYRGDGAYKKSQPWDVRSDGSVVYVTGVPFDFSWAAIRHLASDGRPAAMPEWGAAESDGGNHVPLKVPNAGPLRSATDADFSARGFDENGNPGRRGSRPNDIFFTAAASDKGPGYTGYRVGATNTHRVGDLVIDRRTNHLYFGYSQASRLTNGNPDFEPAIVAMDDRGATKWWARGYQENETPPGLQDDEAAWKKWSDAKQSPPDQYIDHVAIDYTNDRLIVVARCHGNGVVNFWPGDAIVATKGRPGFQRRFTGRNGNIHISWMGAYDLDACRITAATYVAELAARVKVSEVIEEGPLRGWPDPNQGWMDVDTTRIHDVAVGTDGRPCVVGVGRRSFTTSDAPMRNDPPTGGDASGSAWSPFARVYDADLGGLAFSTLMRGPTDTGVEEKAAGDEVVLHAVVPVSTGIAVIGVHTGGRRGGSTIPAVGVPSWAASRAPGQESGVIALFPLSAATGGGR